MLTRMNGRLPMVLAVVVAATMTQTPAHAGEGADLAGLRDRLIALAPAGSSARVDTGGRVVLRLAGDAPTALSTMLAAKRGLVTIEAAAPAGPLENLYGGHGIAGASGLNCTSGFMASNGNMNYVITAGHCLRTAQQWYRKGHWLGYRVASQYGPSGDFGLILEEGVTFHPVGAVNTQYGAVAIFGTEIATVGRQLCKMGNNSRYTCGTVTGVDVTVSYRDGVTLTGMIETTICAVSGDSGGPLMTPYQAGPTLYAYGVGILSGGGGDCAAGTYRSYYQPIHEILAWHGLELHPA